MEIVWNYEGLPDESGEYLAVVSEQDFFNGGFEPPRYVLLQYDAEYKAWTTKAAFFVHAWAKLPPITTLEAHGGLKWKECTPSEGKS